MVNRVNPEFYTCSIGRDKDSYVIGNPDWQYAANKFVKQLPDDVIVHCKLCHFVLSINKFIFLLYFFYFYEYAVFVLLKTYCTMKIANVICSFLSLNKLFLALLLARPMLFVKQKQ